MLSLVIREHTTHYLPANTMAGTIFAYVLVDGKVARIVEEKDGPIILEEEIPELLKQKETNVYFIQTFETEYENCTSCEDRETYVYYKKVTADEIPHTLNELAELVEEEGEQIAEVVKKMYNANEYQQVQAFVVI